MCFYCEWRSLHFLRGLKNFNGGLPYKHKSTRAYKQPFLSTVKSCYPLLLGYVAQMWKHILQEYWRRPLDDCVPPIYVCYICSYMCRKSHYTGKPTDTAAACWHHSQPQTTVQLQWVLSVPRHKMTFRPGHHRPSLNEPLHCYRCDLGLPIRVPTILGPHFF